ncbi:E3 ubiquitin-protein ligase Topors-like [Buteo buteo]|uniref:E3 ubiquitin-protein ligase Topors-like n=1 Tax=Buteo buteo TaxID=30397 RepID=UPI003EBA5647
MESVAMELDNRCPICLDSWEKTSFVIPCLHQFCYPCIVRWAESKPECPLCKGLIISIRHSVRADDDFEEHVVILPAAPPVIGHQAERALSRPAAHSPAATQRRAVEIQLLAGPPGGLHANTWASLFRDHPALLQPLLTWVHQELGQLFANQRSRAATVEGLIAPLLVLFGLDGYLLVEMLRATLQNHTVIFVYQLIDVAVQRCSGEARRLLGLEVGHAVGGREGSRGGAPGPAVSRPGSPTPGPAPSNSPEGTNMHDHPRTTRAAPRVHRSRLFPALFPIAEEEEPEEEPEEEAQEELQEEAQEEPQEEAQEAPQEEPEEAMAGPSTASGGRECSPGGPQRAPKRRSGSPEASSPAKKMPPRQQH